jgi:multidrug efflux pump subunit AcrA (membrane-fusion protein)
MTGFFSAAFWALLAVAQFIAGFVLRVLMGGLWLFWPMVLVAFLVATAQPAEAGWFSWLWGSSNTQQLERSAELAQDAARVAAQAAEAQAQQASAQAEQNSRVAEALAQLSQERQALAGDFQALSTLSLQDSQIAAVLNASGPVLVCVAVLVMAGLALWLVNRHSVNDPAELASAMDVLMEEVAAQIAEPSGRPGRRTGSLVVGRHAVPALIGPRNAERDESQEPGDEPMPF